MPTKLPHGVLRLVACAALLLSSSAVAAQDWAVAALDASPRHHEWVEIPSGDRTVHAFVAFPEVAEGAVTLLVIHENGGLTDSVRLFADQAAEAGYIAVAVDLLSDFDAEFRRTSDFATSDAAREALSRLDPARVTADLRAAQAYAAALPASNGKVVVVGFCWGGAQSFRYATNAEGLAAAAVFYGSAPAEGFDRIQAPVYGFYAENDARINTAIPAVDSTMTALGKSYETVIYPGAGHAYMRAGDDPATAADHPNRLARDASWERLREILARL